MPLIPSILPNELFPTYLQRIAGLNGYSTNRQVLSAARAANGDFSGAGCDWVLGLEALSRLNGLEVPGLIAAHSCKQITHGLDWQGDVDEAQPRTSALKSWIAWNDGGQIRLCPDCIDEDISAYRFAVWRRDHQVPGRYSCPKHGAPLAFTDPVWAAIPEECLGRATPIPRQVAVGFAENAYIGRALEVMDLLIKWNRPLDPVRCRTAFQRQLQLRALEPPRRGRFIDFCNAIDQCFPIEWLRLAFPRRTIERGEYQWFAAGLLSEGAAVFSCAALAVGASLVFESTCTAVEAFTGRRHAPKR